jgi:hypothetical protein
VIHLPFKSGSQVSPSTSSSLFRLQEYTGGNV